MKSIALVGYGYWGPNILRNLFENSNCQVEYVCDMDGDRLRLVRKRYPTVCLTTDFKTVLSDSHLDAVVIATPPSSHFDLIRQALISGKDVLVEKPVTTNVLEASEIDKLVKKHKRVLMVDHTFIFSEPIKLIKKIIDSGELGDILYIDAAMVNLGLFQNDSNVIADLGAHEFSIIQYLMGSLPVSVMAQASTHFGSQEDFANIYLEYPKNVSVHIQVSWLSPVKMRRLLVVGTKKMIAYDDIEPTEKIRIYDKGVEFPKNTEELKQIKIGYRFGDVLIPKLDVVESLSRVIDEFLKSIDSRKVEISGSAFSLSVVKLIELSTKAARLGKRIKI